MIGVSWHQIASPTSVTLTHVAFVTPRDGWITGGMGLVLHSMDGGLTWGRQFDGVQAANVALAAATTDMKKFGDDGQTEMNLQAAQSMIVAGPSVPFLDISGSSSKSVIIAGAFGMAFSSDDGGVTWQSLAGFLPNANGLHIYQITQDGNDFAVAGEQGWQCTVPRASHSRPFPRRSRVHSSARLSRRIIPGSFLDCRAGCCVRPIKGPTGR
jgi:photosystem II stability/assembly factor-like uncharacterized protein